MLLAKAISLCKSGVPRAYGMVVLTLGVNYLSESAAVGDPLHLSVEYHLRIVLGKHIDAVALFKRANEFNPLTHSSVADAFTLSEKFEEMLQKFSGNLLRSAVEVAQLWRRDSIMRKLEAMMLVADKDNIYLLSGTGDVIEPDDGVVAIGSGGNYALAAGKALYRNTDLSAKDIARKALEIASEICVFTNGHITVEEA